MADAFVDAKGLKCPMPIVRISAAMKELSQGGTLEIHADDRAFEKDVQAFCRVSGNALENLQEENGVFKAVIKKGEFT